MLKDYIKIKVLKFCLIHLLNYSYIIVYILIVFIYLLINIAFLWGYIM